MSKKDLFAARLAPRDRKADDDAIAAFLNKGGKINKLKDSAECNLILKRRARRQKTTDARGDKDNPIGVIGGRPLFSDLDVLSTNND